ncbi:MAG TPA: DUF2207 domain-containing protein [Nocardioides sp.]|jgi:hypothetical protein|nr:DUF2207 domain-containing protein [Nocardioides sp.]
MKRALLTLVGLAALGVAVLLPVLTRDSSAGAEPDETTISEYDADFTVARNGDLSVTETLTVDFPGVGKHGIFRFFDQDDPSAPRVRRVPHDITVTRDGRPEQVDLSTKSDGRYVVARIGRPDVTVGLGEHTYVISYRIDGVLEPGTNGTPTQFYWNLVPGGWAQPIHDVRLTVHLPAPASKARCAVGAGATTGCRLHGVGTDTLTVRTPDLAPYTPVTLKAGLPIATPPPGDELPWGTKWAPVLGDDVPTLAAVLVLAALAAIGGAAVSRGAFERTPAFPVQYAPPPEIGPAGAVYVAHERVDHKAFVASLLWAAEKGAIDLRRETDGWTISDKGGAQGWANVDPVTARVARLLGGPGGSFTARRQDVSVGQELQSEISGFERATRTWGTQNGYLSRSGLGSAGGVVVVLAMVVAGFAALGTWFGMSITGVIPGAFALTASPLLMRGASTRRTAKGRDLWSRIGGFERMLSTPSSKQRFDFSGRQELYTAYIPWAVAFGCAEAWAKKYRTEVGTEPPVPSYFAGYYAGAHTGDYVSQMVGDFNATVNSSIAAYAATQSHSSGGGGGFSGGGGGGGGGGGSW